MEETWLFDDDDSKFYDFEKVVYIEKEAVSVSYICVFFEPGFILVISLKGTHHVVFIFEN